VFDPLHIRRAATALNHRTDAATIFEKSVPHAAAVEGLQRAAELFCELCPGARVSSKMFEWGKDGSPKAVAVPCDVSGFIGKPISDKRVTDILTSLGCTVKHAKAKNAPFSVTPPLWRLRDLNIPEDFLEEVGRIEGYDSIEGEMPLAPLQIPVRDLRVHKLRDALKSRGCFELVPLSLTSPQVLRKANLPLDHVVAINNPLGEETSVMVPSTLPTLLQHAEANLRLTHETLRTFQWGHVFSAKDGEHLELGILYCAKQDTSLADDPFLQLKEDLQLALRAMGAFTLVKAALQHPPYAHPGRCSTLVVKEQEVGTLCEVHPQVRTTFGLPHRACVALINLSAVLSLPAQTKSAHPLPQFPAIAYDETFTWNHQKPAGDLLHKLRHASQYLEEVHVADLYQGTQHAQGDYNLTLHFTYRAPDRTLTEEEAKKEHEKVMKVAV
jgi:phenylalanyl-tRNA synthetase beta chain